jgi:hypothetical protein
MVAVSGVAPAEASNPFASYYAQHSSPPVTVVDEGNESAAPADMDPFAAHYFQHSPDRPRQEIVPIQGIIKFFFGSWGK